MGSTEKLSYNHQSSIGLLYPESELTSQVADPPQEELHHPLHEELLQVGLHPFQVEPRLRPRASAILTGMAQIHLLHFAAINLIIDPPGPMNLPE